MFVFFTHHQGFFLQEIAKDGMVCVVDVAVAALARSTSIL
jgi:hypothetical protein